jgi:hypothetical protein
MVNACNKIGVKLINIVIGGKREGKKPLRKPRHGWVDNIKMDLEEINWGGMDWIGLA